MTSDQPCQPALPGSRSTRREAITRQDPPQLILIVDVHVEFGRRYSTRVQCLEAAQAAYLELRTALDAGASRMGDGMVIDAAGVVVARISWNGRVWAGRDWQPGDRPILEAPDRNDGAKGRA